MVNKKNKQNVISKLKPSHQEFINNYFIYNCKAVIAYMRTYPNSGYKAAAVGACRLLKKREIVSAIEEKCMTIWKEKDNIIEKSKTFLLLQAIASSNIFDIIKISKGKIIIKDPKDIPPRALQAVKSIDHLSKQTQYGPYTSTRITMHSKMDALKLLVKILNIIDHKNDDEIIVDGNKLRDIAIRKKY